MKVPRRYDEGTQPHHYTSPTARYRQAYFQALDHAGGEIDKRFDQSGLSVVQEVESLLIDSANNQYMHASPEIPEAVSEYVKDKTRLISLV